jgi:DNA-binding response OmpR family regulator
MPAKKTTIFVADDDPQLLLLITRTLELEDFHVLTAKDGEEALASIEAETPAMVILDVMMPKMDGFTVCQKIREFSSVPVMIVTARGRDDDKIKGLNLGADDYLTKPFNVEELVARVRAVLRRTQFMPSEQTYATRSVVTVGTLTIDYHQHLVTIAGQEIDLTPTEYRLLEYLMQNAGRTVTQDLLLEHVWGQDYLGESHMLQVNVNRVRRKIEPDSAHPRYIVTKTGIGYQFITRPSV